ncbi:hypothetical protein NWF24_28125 [Variovorax paradoxus]|jgi:hypothetical protein|uniref:hypothetical protein n=1 Tax=Variovorax paradoxus TaxID=34073 RepID=UPI0021AC9082|nr:hypothetical protein [Variovorax paradoxus]UVH56675.1 hypothetical protein NWF24_28125 [Variovorax paradoxus]
MNELLSNLTNVGWWGSVVVVGILVNFLSQFLYPRLAVLPVKGLGLIRSRSAKRRARFEERVAALKANPQRLPIVIATEHRLYFVASLVMGCAIFILLVLAVLPALRSTLPLWLQTCFFFMSSLLFVGGTQIADKGFETGRVVGDATRDW